MWLVFFFFFSSRRRHTRSLRDWSSDACSSDLDPSAAACVGAERAMLAALDGSCRTPIAGLATIDGDRLTLEALLLSHDGRAERRGRTSGAVADARRVGGELGERLRRGAGPEFGFG